MNCLSNKFIKVTDHYGYRLEQNVHGYAVLWVVYRVGDTKHKRPISGYILQGEAVKCCKYLEKLNEPKFKKEKTNNVN